MTHCLKQMYRMKLVFLFYVIIAGLTSTIFWIKFTNVYRNVQIKENTQHAASQIKENTLDAASQQILLHRNYSKQKTFLMLFWGFPWNLKSYVPREGPTGDGCEVTHNRSRLTEADIVVFHFTTISSQSMPWKHYRSPQQIFLWWTAENPAVLGAEGSDKWDAFDNFFNWTWTYRRDADVQWYYGYRGYALGLPRGKKVVDDIIASKKKLAIWIVSRCDYTAGARKRMALAKALREVGLNFDGYGKCFSDSPPISRLNGIEMPERELCLNYDGHRKCSSPIPRSNDNRMVKTVKEYKFYFAFENGLHCKDYITEKFWQNGLELDAVPIVWGPTKEDILSVAPLDSFIFVEDYESPQKLAEYIKFLDKHEDEYRKYFRWRLNEIMTDSKMIAMTKERYPNLIIQEPPKKLCEVLKEKRKRKIIRSLKTDFIENNPKECTE